MARAVPCGDGWEDAVAIIRAGPGGKGTATVAMACPVRHGAVAAAARVQAGRAGASSQRAAVQVLARQESESPEREKAPSTVCKYPGGLEAFKGTESSPKFSQPMTFLCNDSNQFMTAGLLANVYPWLNQWLSLACRRGVI